MQNTLFKQPVVYTILYASIFTGCGIFWGTKKEQKNDTKTLASQPEKPIKEKKSDQPVAYGSSPTKSSSNLAKLSGNNGVNQDIKNSINQDIKEEIEEELQKEEQRLKEEEKWLEEEWTQNGSSDGAYSAVEPTAPDLPPPPYDPSWAPGSTDANPGGYAYIFEADDLEDIRKNLPLQKKCVAAYLKVVSRLQSSVPLWLNKHSFLYEVKEELQLAEKEKIDLKNAIDKVAELGQPDSCTKERANRLRELIVKTKANKYKITYLNHIIKKINKKNNKSDQPSNEKSVPYPTQTYASVDPSAPPLYPDLSD